MADKETVVHIGENSPEKVALDMTYYVRGVLENHEDQTRKGFLDTYAECLLAVRGYRNLVKK